MAKHGQQIDKQQAEQLRAFLYMLSEMYVNAPKTEEDEKSGIDVQGKLR